MKRLLLSAVVTAAMVSCTQQGTAGTKMNTSKKLAQGKTIYDNSCGKCHDLPDPKTHTDEQWVDIMKSMAPKAKLNAEQSALAYDYVTSQN